MTPLEAPEGSVWLYTPTTSNLLDKETFFVVLGEPRRNFYRRYLDLETGGQGELLRDSRLHRMSKRIA